MEKAISATAAAVFVGIRLLALPTEQAQTLDVLTYSHIDKVTVQCAIGEIIEIYVSFAVFDSSSDYTVLSTDLVRCEIRTMILAITLILLPAFFDLRLLLGDLIFIFFENKDDPDDCIQLDMYVGLDGYARVYAKHSTTYGGYENYGRYVDVHVVFCDEQSIYID